MGWTTPLIAVREILVLETVGVGVDWTERERYEIQLGLRQIIEFAVEVDVNVTSIV